MTDDDIRHLLRSKAADATVSDDAWDRIAQRITEPQPTRAGCRLAAAGVAVVMAAGAVFAASIQGPTSQVATNPSTVAPAPADPLPPHVWAAPAGLSMQEAAEAYVLDRTGRRVDRGASDFQQNIDDDHGTALIRGGGLATEVFLHQVDGRWLVDGAVSDLVPIFDEEFAGEELTATILAEQAGTLYYAVYGEAGSTLVTSGERWIGFQEELPLKRQPVEAPYARLLARLTSEGGTVALSETWVAPVRATDEDADRTGGVWPATTDVLAELQAQADAGERADLLDPVQVATAYLAELGVIGMEARVSILWEDFQLGDPNSGELPYVIEETGTEGAVLLRRTGGEGSIWYVVGVTNDALEVVDIRREGATLVLDVKVGADGRLSGRAETAGGEQRAAPVERVEAGQTVSISFADSTGGAVVELRLGDRPDAFSALLVP